jgi:hypothetical protein
MVTHKSLEDREVNNLVIYSIGLLIVALLAFIGSSADPKYDKVFIIYTGIGTIAGVLGTIQGCSRNQGLVIAQMIGLGIVFVVAFYNDIDSFREQLYLLTVSWGYSLGDTIAYLWLFAAQLVIFFYLAIGILFCNRVRLVLARKNEMLQTRLV